MDDISRNSNGVIQENKNPKTPEEETKNRLCDFCGGESVALLYCRADTAKLCISCDLQVHSTNQLFTKHTRSLLCDVCDSSPAVIFCSNHSSVLCQNCDWESHGSVSPVHDRRPLEGFNGCPSVAELLAIFGIDDLGQNKKKSVDSGFVSSEYECGLSDYLIWDTPSVVSLDDLIVSDGSDHNFKVTDVPPLPKNRNSICGQYREEINCQLRQMAKSETNFHDKQLDLEPSSDFHSLAFKDNYQQQDVFFNFEHKLDAAYFPSYEASAFKMHPDATGEDAGRGLPSTPSQNFTDWKVPDENTEIGQCLHQANNSHQTEAGNSVIVGITQIQPKVVPRELTSQERDEAITRYKEKKRTRRYEKQIRYESRKIRAESRVRIKGRFAKMDH